MADADSTSNKQTKETSALHADGNKSALHCIISNAHLLYQTGYNTKTHAPIYVGNAEDLSYLESTADAAITTIAFGISVIGKLMVSQDKVLGYIDEKEVSALGWLINDLGASIVALQNIQTLAGDAVTVSKKFNQ